jgi:hypothetical protein
LVSSVEFPFYIEIDGDPGMRILIEDEIVAHFWEIIDRFDEAWR